MSSHAALALAAPPSRGNPSGALARRARLGGVVAEKARTDGAAVHDPGRLAFRARRARPGQPVGVLLDGKRRPPAGDLPDQQRSPLSDSVPRPGGTYRPSRAARGPGT